MNGPHTVVVGGGVAGLVVAWELARAGQPVTVLESESTPGGALARHRVAGLELDAGADSFATATPAVLELIGDLGLAADVVAPRAGGAWVRHQAGSAPLPAGALLGIPARPWAADSRRALGFLGATRAAADLVLPARVGAAQLTLAGLVRARMGSRVVSRLVEPVAGGVYASDPELLELATVNPRLAPALAATGSLAGAVRTLRAGSQRPGSAVLGLRGGLAGLVPALIAAITILGGEIVADCAVTAVRPAGLGWRMSTATGDLAAEQVVLATDARGTARLLPGSGPAAPTTEVELVTLVLDAPELDPAPRGTGVLVSRRARGVGAKALTHATAKWDWLAEAAGPGRHVLRLSYGREDIPLPAPGPLDEATERARRDAEVLLGVFLPATAVLGAAVRRWHSGLPRPVLGQAEAVARLRAGLPTGLSVVGAGVAGTGLAAVVADARRVAAGLRAESSGGAARVGSEVGVGHAVGHGVGKSTPDEPGATDTRGQDG